MLFLPGWAEVTGGYSWCASCLWHLLCSQWGGLRHHQSSQSAIRYTVIPVMVLAPYITCVQLINKLTIVLDQSWIQILLLTLWVKGGLVVLLCFKLLNIPSSMNAFSTCGRVIFLAHAHPSLVRPCTPHMLSYTHSEWLATGWCTRTLLLFCGGGHCHKRYCSLCDTYCRHA